MPLLNPPRRPRAAFNPPFFRPPPTARITCSQQNTSKVTVRVPRPLGVSLAETRTSTGDAQIIVSAVHPQGSAAGLLHVGDVLLALSDTPVNALQPVVESIRSGNGPVTLVLQREEKERQKKHVAENEVLQLMRMINEGEDADVVLKKAAEIVKGKAVEGGREIKDVVYALKRGNVKLDTRFYNVLMWSYVRAGKAERAVQVFEEIEQPNVECFTTLIKACSMLKRTDDALGVLGKMRKAGVVPNVRTYNALIASCVRGGRMKRARALFSEMLADDVKPNVVSWNILIHWHVTEKRGGKRVRDALKAFNDMKMSGVKPNLVTFTTIMKMYARSGLLDKAEEVFSEMKLRLVGRLDTSVYNVLLAAYANKLEWRRCMELLDEMRGEVVDDEQGLRAVEGLPMHSGSFESRRPWLGGGVFTSGVAKSLKPLDHVEESRFQPDALSYSLVIKACAAAGRPLLAQRVFDEMMQMGFRPPSAQAVVSLLAGYAKSGMLTESFQVLKNLKEWGVVPDKRILSSLMHACLVVKQPALALSVYAKLKSAKFEPDVVTNTLLLKAYAMGGEMDKAFNVLKGMQKEGSKVIPNLVTYNVLIEGSLSAGRRDLALKALEMLLSDDRLTQKVNRNTFYALTLAGGSGGSSLDSLGDGMFELWEEDAKGGSDGQGADDAEGNLQYLMDVLRRVREAGIVPNGILYRALLEGCERLQEWHLGASLVRERDNEVFIVGRRDGKDVRLLEDLFRARSVVEPLA